MNKKTGIVLGIVIIVALAGFAIGTGKKAAPQKPKTATQKTQTVNKTQQTPENVKARAEAFRYMNEAHRKARQGDYEGAMAACDSAVQAEPNNPIAKSCKDRINRIINK